MSALSLVRSIDELNLDLDIFVDPFLCVILFPQTPSSITALVGHGNNSGIVQQTRHVYRNRLPSPSDDGDEGNEELSGDHGIDLGLNVILLRQIKSKEKFTLGYPPECDIYISMPDDADKNYSWINRIHCQLSTTTFSLYNLATSADVKKILPQQDSEVKLGCYHVKLSEGLEFQMKVLKSSATEAPLLNGLLLSPLDQLPLDRPRGLILRRSTKGKVPNLKPSGKAAASVESKVSGQQVRETHVAASPHSLESAIKEKPSIKPSQSVLQPSQSHSKSSTLLANQTFPKCSTTQNLLDSLTNHEADHLPRPLTQPERLELDSEIYISAPSSQLPVKGFLAHRGRQILAIKQYLPPFSRVAFDTWRNEVNVLTSINHRAIASLIYYDGIALRLDLEHVGPDLSTFITPRSDKRKKEKDMCTITDPRTHTQIWADISAGLTYLHEKGIVHLDIKPQNILLLPQPLAPSNGPSATHRAKICDFGTSVQTIAHSSNGGGVIHTGGTPSYVPSEFLYNNRKRGFASDVWALGIVMLWMCGTMPLPRERWIIAHVLATKGGEERSVGEMLEWLNTVEGVVKNLEEDESGTGFRYGLLRRMLIRDPNSRVEARELVGELDLELQNVNVGDGVGATSKSKKMVAA